MSIEEINKQVKDSPLTKEECRAQFVENTKNLDLKHSFDFDEAWEIGQELRKRKDFRKNITTFEEKLRKTNGVLTQEEMQKLNPVKHSFADGCYIREIFNPANELLVTKIHKKEHPFFLLKGKMSIATEEGVKNIKAPYYGITKPGTKRVIYTHTDCIFVTVHATNSTNIEEIEEEVIAKNFNDPEITLEDINALRDSGINFEQIENEKINNKK
jgi:hypothetical protein